MTTRTLPWTPPPAVDVEALLVGKRWDAVSTAVSIGDRALQLLGNASGAVIQDDTHGKLYWLIGVDTARGWCLRHVRVLTALADETVLLGVPPTTWTDGHDPYWRVPLGPGRYLTDTQRLHEALAQATIEICDSAPQGSSFVSRDEGHLPFNSVEPKAHLELGGVS
ncbi:hypothetical protein [Streptomyces malaysiensis]|uniref:hypothetical protein n=1 Tax=Streptomyces malaysiensis TaxID=92644 RepID=UPI0015E0738A|nr:hypothetical protein [Streptomyces malaysiensis]